MKTAFSKNWLLVFHCLRIMEESRMLSVLLGGRRGSKERWRRGERKNPGSNSQRVQSPAQTVLRQHREAP